MGLGKKLVVNEVLQYYASNTLLTLIDASKAAHYINLFKLLISRNVCPIVRGSTRRHTKIGVCVLRRGILSEQRGLLCMLLRIVAYKIVVA